MGQHAGQHLTPSFSSTLLGSQGKSRLGWTSGVVCRVYFPKETALATLFHVWAVPRVLLC